MLAKVSKKRRDGGSSFRSLIVYITQEVDEKTGEIVGRGEVWTSAEILDPATADKEMKLVALMNVRCADPVYHYILTWREGEAPTCEQWQASVRDTLAALGLSGHQAVAVAHTNTGNFHVHVAVNRVHPESYKAHSPAFSHRSLDECLRRLEKRFAWQEDHGLFVWNEELQQPVRTPKYLLDRWRREREEQGRGAIGKAGARETFADLESLEGYCRGEPARAVRKTFDANGCSWQSLHETLARYGLALHSAERGGYTVSRIHQPEPRVKASKAFREVFAGKKLRALLERRLGPFEASAGPLPHAETIYKPNRPHRGEQRERRALLRNNLVSRYRDHKRSLPPPALPSAQEIKQRRQAITDYFRAEREKIKASALAPAERRAALSVLAMQAVQAREVLRAELREQRATAKAAAAPKPWTEWVADQAGAGDQAAISALRGIAYADRRRRRAMELADKDESVNAIMAADRVPRDPEEPPRNLLADIQWQVNRQTGAVTYTFRAGRRFPLSFTDEGRRIVLTNAATRSRDAIEAGLKLARQKFGPVLTGPLNPVGILVQGFSTIANVQDAIAKADPGWFSSIGYSLLGIIISVLILLCYLLIAGQMALVMIKAYLWICVAPILLGFGSIKNFRDIATNTMKSSISMGAIILMVYVIAGVAKVASLQFGALMAQFGNDNWTPLWALLSVMGILAFAALQVPKFANDFINGTVSGGVGEVMGAAIGAAAGAAAVAAGGAAVAKSTAGAATDQLAGVMKAAGAAMQDAGDHGRSGVGAFLHASGALAGATGGVMADTGKSAVKSFMDRYNSAGEGTAGGKVADKINAGRGGSIANTSSGGNGGASAPGGNPNVGNSTRSTVGNSDAGSLPSGAGAIGGTCGSGGNDGKPTAGPSLAESIRDLQGYVPDDSASVGVNANLGYHPHDDI